jgi:tRNA threonylcarbamoyladenosine biosynthesis protein TsaE
MELISNSVEKTQDIAGQLVREIIAKKPAKKCGACTIALTGDLGAGKTAFIQGLAQALGVKEKVLSPTFLIMRCFGLSNGNGEAQKSPFSALYHFDFYRLSHPKEVLDLGYEEIMGNKEHLVVMEWADRFKNIVPKDAIWVKLEWLAPQKRKISVA